ncbi:nitroreductase family protein [Acidicapsa dinghuensis]|uniref:Nitroreductase family protein n=1 Tax=Acidicapsa dinghuensis TaxID=2218256 RepID=A0ABW1EAB0_9BACT|nr:nitroreductase family protein [Acidicapsa dinghuensis]
MALSAVEVNQRKQAPVVEGVIPVFFKRWSPRSFIDKPVDKALVEKAFEAARWAASSYNEQPWRYVVGFKGDEAYGKILSVLNPFNQAWAKTAPVLILGFASTKFAHNGSENRFALHDLGAASAYLTLQSAELGLYTHSMAGLDYDAAVKVFDVPADFIAGAAIALGYQGEPAALPNEQMQAQEESERRRRPLSETVFSAWGVPAQF